MAKSSIMLRIGKTEGIEEQYNNCFLKFGCPANWIDLAKQNGYNVTDYSRQVVRQLKGSFVIFSKNSFYNRTTGTYDGRHEKMSGDDFRLYIEKVYEKYKKAPDNVYINDF